MSPSYSWLHRASQLPRREAPIDFVPIPLGSSFIESQRPIWKAAPRRRRRQSTRQPSISAPAMPRTRGQRQGDSSAVVDLTEPGAILAQGGSKRKRSDDGQADASKSRRLSGTESMTPVLDVDAAAEITPQDQTQHTRIGAMACIICMENYTDATVAHCGHIFCHECLTRALTASEQNSHRGIGVCPSCRKPISKRKANQIIPINFMKKKRHRNRAS